MSELPAPRPDRTRVRADAAASPPPASAATEASTFYADRLRRSQLRLSLIVAAGFLVVLSVLAVATSAWPLLESVRPGGLPLSWWIIGFALYPLVLGAAMFHAAAARRLERRYRQVAGR